MSAPGACAVRRRRVAGPGPGAPGLPPPRAGGPRLPRGGGVAALLEPVALGDRGLLLRTSLLGHLLEPPLGGLQIGEQQLGVDGLGVANRVDAAVRVRHAGIAVAADDVADRVGFADRGEELVAEALALGGAL